MNKKRVVLGVFFLAMFSVACAEGSFSTRDADFYLQLRDWSRLLQYSSSWTQQRPHEARGWYYLGTAYLSGLGQAADAIGPLQRATELKPDWDAAWSALGSAYLHVQRCADAARAFEQAAKLAPTNPGSWNNLASAYAGADDRDRAEKALDAEKAQASRWASNADWYALGNGYASLGHYLKAVDAYQHALRLDERLAEAWNNLAVAEEHLGRWSDAVLHYQHAAALGDELGRANATRLQSAAAGVGPAQAHPS